MPVLVQVERNQVRYWPMRLELAGALPFVFSTNMVSIMLNLQPGLVSQVSVALSLGVLTLRGSRLQGTKGDGRLKTTTSWVGHRLHAWMRTGSVGVSLGYVSGRPRWAGQH